MDNGPVRIAVAGLGYVGLSMAVIFAERHKVTGLDISAERVESLRRGVSPIHDADIQRELSTGGLDVTWTTEPHEAYADADIVVIATPTDYDPDGDHFDTSSVEAVIAEVTRLNPDATMVIKSTIPVGFVDQVREQHGIDTVIFSPEFLREGRALHDNRHPSRIIVGDAGPRGQQFARLLEECSLHSVPVLFTSTQEAEAIKLFANTYLAMRVAFFNELDTFAASKGLNTRQIVEGVSLDPRVGNHYNNPSFGYGGYCLPKDTRQLLANYRGVPQRMMSAIVDANDVRKHFVAQEILDRKPGIVGLHRLIMKAGSDNFRSSSIQDVMAQVQAAGVPVVIYEPELAGDEFHGAEVVHDLRAFKDRVDLIVTNRMTRELEDVAGKVYTRDLFGSD